MRERADHAAPTPPPPSGAAPEGPRPAGAVPARPAGPYRTGGPGPSGDRRFGPRRPRRKICTFCADKVKRIDYREVARLRRYLSDRAKIEPRRKTGSCAKHQRMLTTALKRARHMALLPYTAEQVRAMMSPQARALAGGPPPPKPERPPRLEPPPGPPHHPPPGPPHQPPAASS